MAAELSSRRKAAIRPARCLSLRLTYRLASPRILWLAAVALVAMHADPRPAQAQFSTVINVPPSPNLGNNAQITSDQQLNLLSSGVIGKGFSVGQTTGNSSVELNVAGGTVGSSLRAQIGSVVNISSGSVGSDFVARAGSQVDVSGGSVGSRFQAVGGAVTMTGGSIGTWFSATSNAVVNISGGTVGTFAEVARATVNVFGGTVGDSFTVAGSGRANIFGGQINGLSIEGQGYAEISGGMVDDVDVDSGGAVKITGGQVRRINSDASSNLIVTGGLMAGSVSQIRGAALFAGGSLGHHFYAHAGANVTFQGADFRINGAPVSQPANPGDLAPLSFGADDTLTGTLADGTPFTFSTEAFDSADAGTLFLRLASVPPAGPPHLLGSANPLVSSLRSGQTLEVDPGANMPKHFRAGWGSRVHVNGGRIGTDLEAAGATIDLESGAIGAALATFVGATVNISGGRVERAYYAYAGSTVNLSGGVISAEFEAREGSKLNIYGSDFRVDGVPITDLQHPGDALPLNPHDRSVLSGTLVDGTPFTSQDWSFIWDDTLTLHSAPVAQATPRVIDAALEAVSLGIREGQTLLVGPGAQVPYGLIAGWESSVKVVGGQVQDNLTATHANIKIDGGSVGNGLDAAVGTHVVLTSGSIGTGFSAKGGTIVDISDGAIGASMQVTDGSTLNMSGGVIGDRLLLAMDSRLNLSGGAIGSRFYLGANCEMNLQGTKIILNGVDITSTATPSLPLTIVDRNVPLSVILKDGNTVNFDLNSNFATVKDFFAANALLTFTLVPEPTATCLALSLTPFAFRFHRRQGPRSRS